MQGSEECAKSELDLFSIPPTQTSIEEGVWDNIYPQPNFQESAVLRFDIPGTNNHYLNLGETELHLKVSLRKKGTDAPMQATDKVGVVNNLLHSIFKQVQVYLNDSPVENSNNTYPYRAFLENALCYNKEAKETILRSELFMKDTNNVNDYENFDNVSGIFDREIIPSTTPKTFTREKREKKKIGNEGFVARRKLFICPNPNDTNPIVPFLGLVGKLHCDIFNLNRYMLNNVDIGLILSRAPTNFFLKGSAAKDFKFRIEDAFLKVRRAVISPSVMLAHAIALEKTTAKYPFKRVLVKPITIPYSSNNFSLSGIHNGMMPSRVVVGFVNTIGFEGSFESNAQDQNAPFQFLNLSISEIALKLPQNRYYILQHFTLIL